MSAWMNFTGWMQEWGGHAIGGTALILSCGSLWISYRQHKATTSDKAPTVRFRKPLKSEEGGEPHIALPFEIQNHSEKPLILDDIQIKGVGDVRFSAEFEYSLSGRLAGPKMFELHHPRLPDRVRPAGTAPHEYFRHSGDKYSDSLYFTASRADGAKMKIIISYRFGNEDAKLHRQSFYRTVSSAA